MPGAGTSTGGPTSRTAAPRVSIIVPVMNGERTLRESLDSILAQSFADREVIVMDDASTDGTEAIARSYGGSIRYERQLANRGIYDNVNDGIALARGKLVAVYHADDIYLPAMVERQVALFDREPGLGAVFALDVWVDAEGREYGRLSLPNDVPPDTPMEFADVLNALLRHKNIFFVCPTAMVPAEVYRLLGGYRQSLFRNSSDLDMWVRIAKERKVAIVGEHLMKYRHFHASSSNRYHHLRTEPERFFAIMDHHLGDGARAIASPDALRAYEAHRSEDRLMIAIAFYIKADRRAARESLRGFRLGTVLRTREVQRFRLAILFLALSLLVRLPRIGMVADFCYRRWHARKRPA
jgi:GT2 family glycosyltransferase